MKRKKFSWPALIFGPLWYFYKGFYKKGTQLLFLLVLTLGFGLPLIWIYCGIKANSDLSESELEAKSQYDVNKI